MELKELLMKEAHKKGICIDGFRDMRKKDIDELVDYYIIHPNWCMQRNFPQLDTLTESFACYEGKGVFINREFNGEELSSLQTYVFHNCKGRVNVAMDYGNAVIPMLYFANGCDMTICCEQQNIHPIHVPLYIFGDNDINAIDSRNVIFTIYKYPIIHE